MAGVEGTRVSQTGLSALRLRPPMAETQLMTAARVSKGFQGPDRGTSAIAVRIASSFRLGLRFWLGGRGHGGTRSGRVA